MTFTILYICIWAAWAVWVQTVGRISLGLGSVLAFDALLVAALFLFRKQLNFRKPTVKIHWLAVPALASIGFTAIFQVPFDWDGLDYHLPPLVEAWNDGYWHHSQNPYVQARAYPKAAGFPFLWWIAHFGSFLGLRGILLVPVIHWAAGLVILRELFGRSKWIFLFWAAFPLAARGAVTAYADLPALTTLLAFALFAIRGKFALAGLALALHASTKFTHLASAAGAVAGLLLWWRLQGKAVLSRASFKALATIGVIAAFGAFSQPVENVLTEGKPFGVLKCKVFGHDFCDGSIDPNDMVVAPTLDYPREQPWPIKVLRGWTPSQLVPGADVEKGGIGWAWLVPLAAALLTFRKRSRAFWKELRADRRALGALIILGVADLAIPALWYARYHMALGVVLIVIAARWMAFSENARTGRAVWIISFGMLALQLLWIAPQRTWFLGKKPVENLASIVKRGYPAHATHPADRRSIQLYGQSEKHVIVCGSGLRPVLPAYGATLSNEVTWSCEGPGSAPSEVLKDGTKYWLTSRNL